MGWGTPIATSLALLLSGCASAGPSASSPEATRPPAHETEAVEPEGLEPQLVDVPAGGNSLSSEEADDAYQSLLQEEVDVDLFYLPSEDRWRVTWSFSEPARGVILSDSGEQEWELGEGLELGPVTLGKRTFQTADGSLRQEFSATLSPSDPDEEYAQLVTRSLSDGGRILSLWVVIAHAYVPTPRGVPIRDPLANRQWRIHSGEGLRVHVEDQGAIGGVIWEPEEERLGAIAYFGPTTPRQGDCAGFLDPELPTWITNRWAQDLDTVFRFFHQELGLPAPTHCNLFATWGGRSASGIRSRGSAIETDAAIEVLGAVWQNESHANIGTWFRVLAHEVFHFWNAKGRSSTGNRWLVEGGATLAAHLALQDRVSLSDATVGLRMMGEANGCLTNLRGRLAPGEQNNRLHYACGSWVLFLAHRELPDGIFPLFAELFATAGGRYGTEDFYRLYQAALPRSTLPGFIRQLRSRGFSPRDYPDISERMRAAGVGNEIRDGRFQPAVLNP